MLSQKALGWFGGEKLGLIMMNLDSQIDLFSWSKYEYVKVGFAIGIQQSWIEPHSGDSTF